MNFISSKVIEFHDCDIECNYLHNLCAPKLTNCTKLNGLYIYVASIYLLNVFT